MVICYLLEEKKYKIHRWKPQQVEPRNTARISVNLPTTKLGNIMHYSIEVLELKYKKIK